MTVEEMQARLHEISDNVFHGRADQGDAEDLKVISNEFGKRFYRPNGDIMEGLLAQLEQAVFEFHTKNAPHTHVTDARSLVIFEAHQRQRDVEFWKAKAARAEQKGVEKGRAEMRQALLTLLSNTAPEGPWADRAVHEFVATVLSKKAEKSPYLIDILKD